MAFPRIGPRKASSSSRCRTLTTISQIYIERDRIPQRWTAVAYGASSTLLLVFILFPSTYGAGVPSSDGTGTPLAIPIISLILLTLTCLALPILYYRYRNPSYRLDCIAIPSLTATLLGHINSIFRAAHRSSHSPNSDPALDPPRWPPFAITAVLLSALLTLLSATAVALNARTLSRIRAANAYSYLDAAGPDDADLLPEDEASRQQFLKLLRAQQELDRPPPPHQARPRLSLHFGSGAGSGGSGAKARLKAASAAALQSQTSLQDTYRLEIPAEAPLPALPSREREQELETELERHRQRQQQQRKSGAGSSASGTTEADRIAFPGFEELELATPSRTGRGARERVGRSPAVGTKGGTGAGKGDGTGSRTGTVGRSPDSMLSREARRAEIERGG